MASVLPGSSSCAGSSGVIACATGTAASARIDAAIRRRTEAMITEVSLSVFAVIEHQTDLRALRSRVRRKSATCADTADTRVDETRAGNSCSYAEFPCLQRGDRP